MTVDYSIVVPVYNEGQVLSEFYSRLSKVLDSLEGESEIIFVNDGSQDDTERILRELNDKDGRVKLIHLSRNFGHQVAITAGMDHAQGRACIIMDADLQDPPEVIPKMLQHWQDGFHVVHAVRRRRQGETLFKLATANIFYKLLKKLTYIDIQENVGDFKLLDQKVIKVLKECPERNRFIRGLVSWVGFKHCSIVYDRGPRAAGETKYPLRKMLKFAWDGITSFSYAPLKLATWIGIFASFVSFLLVGWVLWAKFFMKDKVELGWASLMVAVLFVGGVQLLTFGILGEYVGRIFDEVKQRPVYLIREKIGFE